MREQDDRKHWAEIIEAWAKWVRGEGPPVQYWVPGDVLDGVLVDWTDEYRILKYVAGPKTEWRVKTEPRRVRMFLTPGVNCNHVEKAEWLPGHPEPDVPLGSRWIPGHDWVEVPE